MSINAVDVERFARLNICGFKPIEVFAELLSYCLGKRYLLFSLIKERNLYLWKQFRGSPENHENSESLAPRLC